MVTVCIEHRGSIQRSVLSGALGIVLCALATTPTHRSQSDRKTKLLWTQLFLLWRRNPLSSLCGIGGATRQGAETESNQQNRATKGQCPSLYTPPALPSYYTNISFPFFDINNLHHTTPYQTRTENVVRVPLCTSIHSAWLSAKSSNRNAHPFRLSPAAVHPLSSLSHVPLCPGVQSVRRFCQARK